MYLINTILGYLEAGDVDLLPMCSREKPYYQDSAFLATIRPYYRLYITSIDQVTYKVPVKQLFPSFNSQTLTS